MKVLLEVVVRDKCVVTVKYYNRCYILTDEDNHILARYGLEENAYIEAIKYGFEKDGDGNCIAYYPNETIIFKNFKAISHIKRISSI